LKSFYKKSSRNLEDGGFSFGDSTAFQVSTECGNCGNYLNCCNPKLKASGSGSNGILLLLETPSKEEDYYGEAGTLNDEQFLWLKNQLEEIGISYDDCWKVNAVGCYSSIKKPKLFKFCQNRIDAIIREKKPRLIIAFGTDTLQVTVANTFTRGIGDIIKWRGFCIPERRWGDGNPDDGIWIMHVESPMEIIYSEALQRNNKWKRAETFLDKVFAVERTSYYRMHLRTLKEDIRNAYIKSSEPIPKKVQTTIIPRVILSEIEALDFLKHTYHYLKENPQAILVMDTETSSLKSYNRNTFLYSVSMLADIKQGATSFLITPLIIKALQKIFTLNPRIAGANWKFDYCFLKNKANIDAYNLYHDTVLMAHILDNRDGITSLKFCGYVYYGQAWEDTVHKYLEAEGGCNELNRIRQAPVKDLLYYGSLDVIMTYLVMVKQLEQFEKEDNPNKEFARKLFYKGSIALAKLELTGVPMDLEKAKKNMAFCEGKMREIECRIKDNPVWKEWGDIVGVNERTLLSDTQIIKVFITNKKLWPVGINRSSKPKADHEWLSKMIDQEPFLQNVLDYRKYQKMSQTYLRSFLTETNDDGRIRSFYTLNNVSSFRTASNSPNLQNQASRDAEMVELLKGCFKPPEGWFLTSMDVSGLENAVSANITGDEYMLGCVDGSVDMHIDNCLQAFCFSKEEYDSLAEYDEQNHKKFAKTARNGGKLSSFQNLFGSGKETAATSLWKYMVDKDVHVTPTETAKERVIKVLQMEDKYSAYLIDNKNKRDKEGNPIIPLEKEEFFYTVYENYAQALLDDFWNNRMKTTKEWRDNLFENFLKTGKIQYPVGLTVRGLGVRNFLLNSIIQGSSSCIVLFALIIFTEKLEQLGFKGRPCMTIHDDIVGLVPKEELDEFLALQKYCMEVATARIFKWLKVPLRVEAEISDTSWADKKKYKGFIPLYEKKYLKNL